jgi:hypothetical protein
LKEIGFPVGEADYTSRFKFPQKLYGRESELKEIGEYFQKRMPGMNGYEVCK